MEVVYPPNKLSALCGFFFFIEKYNLFFVWKIFTNLMLGGNFCGYSGS